MNQGWTRVPSVLNTATETFSDSAKKSEVEAFRQKIESENKLGSFAGTFDGIIGKFHISLYDSELSHFKMGCVFPMVFVSIIPHAELGPTDGWKDLACFT